MDTKNLAFRINKILKSKGYRPATVHEIAVKLNIPVKSRAQFFKILNKMRVDGQIEFTPNGKIISNEKGQNELATILSVGKNGAYARLYEDSTDVFISPDDLNGAMPSDTVKLKIIKRNCDRRQAVVMTIVERGFCEFTGIFHRIGKHAYVTPDAKYKGKIRVDPKEVRLINDGDMVFAKMRNYEKRGCEAKASIIKSYGAPDSANACCQAILDKFHARKVFPNEVLDEAKSVSSKFEIGDDRLDLRHLPIFTIDGATAKDLDDAVSVGETENGYRLGVHIADVSHYVLPNSQLDEEAYLRGTSIYFGNSVIPMLPKELSNGICSLNPGEERLTFSAFMDIDSNGSLISYKLKKSIIRSRVKGVYSEVNKIFNDEADDELLQKYSEVLPSLKIMRKLAALLRRARSNRGAFDFETDESELIIGEDGKAIDVRRRERGEAERLIEEFMLCANEAVATFAFSRKLPFVYRIHEEPEEGKLAELAASLNAAGIDTRAIHPGLKPADIKRVLDTIKGSPKEKALNSFILRSMSKARYSPDCIGHFGLSLKYYCHFTSPIRRYPDLAIHRILSDLLRTKTPEELTKRYSTFVTQASDNSSAREVAAMQIEWSCEDAYKAEYMSSHIGEQFTGHVSSVKSFGMYVILENTVEGLVRIEDMPGWYDFDEQNMTLKNKTTGKTFTVGDPVKVILAATDIPSGHIDFTLI